MNDRPIAWMRNGNLIRRVPSGGYIEHGGVSGGELYRWEQLPASAVPLVPRPAEVAHAVSEVALLREFADVAAGRNLLINGCFYQSLDRDCRAEADRLEAAAAVAAEREARIEKLAADLFGAMPPSTDGYQGDRRRDLAATLDDLGYRFVPEASS